jgi:hypothetical protein
MAKMNKISKEEMIELNARLNQINSKLVKGKVITERVVKTINRNGLEVEIVAVGNLYKFPSKEEWETAEFLKTIEEDLLNKRRSKT